MTRRRKLVWLAALVVSGAIIAFFASDPGEAVVGAIISKVRGGYSVADRLGMHGADVSARVKAKFLAAGLPYPPRDLAILAFKDSRRVEVYGTGEGDQPWVPVLRYDIQGMSGKLGPKLREGDRQVPEGIYYVEFLNANSRFHLSIRLNYPNRYDRAQAVIDGRTHLGSDIMIHGMASSIGCLAMGNEAAEDLFVLAALVGKERIIIVVAPTDFRRGEIAQPIDGPTWLPQLYERLRVALRHYPPFPS
jgi:hypothetical protein